MKGYFSEESLNRFSQLAAESAGIDFAENSYDFARCIMPNGEIYGTDGQCKMGKPLAEKESSSSKDKGKESERDKKLTKLTQWFRAKKGKDMTPKQMASVANRIGVPIPSGKSAEDVLKGLIPKGEKVMPVKSA
jgi:hypothetical protein